MDMSMFSGGVIEGGSGLGNLADELADAFFDDEDEYYDEAPPDAVVHVADEQDNRGTTNGIQDSGDDAPSLAGIETGVKIANLSLPTHFRKGHRKAGSEYDGSGYGSETDLDSPGMPMGLVSKIDLVESLARRGLENNGGVTDGVFLRVTDHLRDLGSQAGVEGSATRFVSCPITCPIMMRTIGPSARHYPSSCLLVPSTLLIFSFSLLCRLITAHSALTTHLSHQTRQLHSLAFPLFSPFATPLDPDTIDELLPLLLSLSDNMPRPPTNAHQSITALHSVTTDLIQTLNYLSDTLQMSRQTTTTATRRLKSAKELVSELRQEEELREEGERWLARGNWSERLKNRECASVCGEVVGGFEEVCNGWRERLLAQAAPAQA
jgi:hypothetical protein